MSRSADSPPPSADPTRVAVAGVVQTMVARRLARSFLPLVPVFLFGAVMMAWRGPLVSDYAVLALGAPAAGAALLLYGNGAVKRALGGWGRGRVALATSAGLVPYAFGLYLLALRSLEPIAGALGGEESMGLGPTALAVLFGMVAARFLWHVSRLTELHRLARTMTAPAPEERP